MAVQFTDRTIYLGYGQIIYRYNYIYGIWSDNFQVKLYTWDMAVQFTDKLYIWDMVVQFTDKTIYMGYGRTIYR